MKKRKPCNHEEIIVEFYIPRWIKFKAGEEGICGGEAPVETADTYCVLCNASSQKGTLPVGVVKRAEERLNEYLSTKGEW